MSKQNFRIILIVASLVILSGLAIAYWCKHPPFFYYRQFTSSPHELPTRLIRRAYRVVTNRDLPEKVDDLHAIFTGGREPAIFVRFKTDSSGIAYILEAFDGPDVKSETLDKNRLREWTASRVSIFPTPSLWQKEIGVNIFDQESIESGRLIEFMPGSDPAPGYRIFIDDQGNTVYINSWLH